jgi:predicted nucleic acid-binding protein
MSEQELRVVLDASAIIGAGYGRSLAFRRLLREAGDHRVQLLVPELAILETCAVLRRKLENLKIASKETSRLLAAGGVHMPGVDDLVTDCERHIRQSLAATGVVPLPSQGSHDEIVRRILTRRKPTKAAARDAQGRELDDQPEDYRDQLLWAMVRDTAKTGPVVFISDNTADFANEATVDRTLGRADLHADLLADLEAHRPGGAANVKLFLTIRRAADELLPRPEDEDDRDEMQSLIRDRARDSFRLALRDAVAAQPVAVNNYLPPVPLTSDIEEASLDTLDSLADSDISDAYQEADLDAPRRYVVSVDVRGEGTVAWYVSAVSPYDHEALSSIVESPDAGGIIQDYTSGEAVELTVAGVYIPSEDVWEDVEVDYAQQPDDISAARRAEVPDPELDRLVEAYERAERQRAQ